MNILRLFMAIAMTYGYLSVNAQLQNAKEIAIAYMQSTLAEEGYDVADFQDFEVIHSYESANNGVTHIYIAQQYQGVEVENAIFNVNILPDGTVFHHGNKTIKQVASKIINSTPTIGCHEAFGKCLSDIGILDITAKVRSEKKNEIRFVKPDGAAGDVMVRKLYALQPSGKYRMVWDMTVITSKSGKSMHYQIDVASGLILKKEDTTIRCQFDHKDHDAQCRSIDLNMSPNGRKVKVAVPKRNMDLNQMMDNAQYNVYPIPGESPNHINRSMIVNPADPIASPFGWHDTDGVAGAEFTTTEGNNVHAEAEHNGDGQGDGNEPNGGSSLIFDLPININAEPKSYTDAAVVNLFYMNNVLHDVAFRYGFDEAAGNFQETNYSGQGNGNDSVDAFAQSSIDEDPNGDNRNNATFSTSSEGFGGSTMNMFIWERGFSASDLLEILAPAELAGIKFRGHQANFGPALTSQGVTASVAEADDSNACAALTNPGEVAGKIAIIDRGICNFDLKVQNAKNAGAIAVVVCNYEDSSIPMGGSIDSGIPAIMIGNQDCATLRASVSQGLQIALKEPPLTGPNQVDGTLDNGIVAHEYGHGISTRLVGGAQRSCLRNDQQMGEGWSDFFTLILSVEDGDTGATPRGIGTFVQRDDTDGLGIRRFAYSTDMSTNPLTLGDVVLTGNSPHQLGTVWCSMIWDLYWALAERDGFDSDVYTGTGGNNTAIQLVMDGMKMMDCSPSFIDARDAILAADVANNGGANQQIIWEVFARRGLGESAITGVGGDRTEIIEAFDIPGQFDPGLKIEKTVTELINPGDDITVALKVTNDLDATQTAVVLTDIVPSGLSYVDNSASQVVQVNGDQLLFNVGSISAGASTTVSFRLSSGGVDFSDFLWFDGFEEVNGKWIEEVVEGKEGWNQSGARQYNGDFSIFIKNDTVVTDRALRIAAPVDLSGTVFPVLRFYHYMKSERGYDPGIVQLSRNGGASWDDAGPLIFKNGYTGKIPYQPFAIPNQKGYYGDTEGFIESYVDLRDYIGDDLLFRFRYGSDDSTNDEGWYIDEVSVFDMNSFQSEACVSSTETVNPTCTEAEAFGSIVNYDLVLDVDEPNLVAISQVELYPNPASEMINITITGEQITRQVDYKVFNISGKYMSAGQLIPTNGNVDHPIDVSNLPVGMYFVNFTIGDQQVSKRFVRH